jgi:stearoyl-CoA desaturase (delta-9 desaturase)
MTSEIATTPPRESRGRLHLTFVRWFDSWAGAQDIPADAPQRIDWMRCLPFLGVHLACFAVLWVGWSWFAVGWAVALYALRMLAMTGFYHRYFSHRSFKTSRAFQLVLAIAGNSSAQRGPLWWAGHHRHHHQHSDKPSDVHSPEHHGLWWSHVGWIMSRPNFRTRLELVPDLAKFRELRFLDRFDVLVPALVIAASVALGALLARTAPSLGVDAAQLGVWTLVSTVVLFHGTFTINSLSHLFGSRRYETPDTSRNNALLALITMGEGWHNNHHHSPRSARSGLARHELDPTWWMLLALEKLGLIWDLHPVPAHVMERARGGRRAG